MQTLLKGKKKEVLIDTEGPITIIGEKINPTGRKRLAAALVTGDMQMVRELALSQVQAGADILDINVGVPGVDDVNLMIAVVRDLSSVLDVPFCLDSPNPRALQAGLEVVPGKPLVNSVTGEEASLQSILPLVKDRGAAVIGLIMDDSGIPTTPEERLQVAEKILSRAVAAGIPAEDVLIDPLVMAVGADGRAAWVTLKTIELVREKLGVNISLGASNVSHGLPERPLVNQAFLALAMGAGATCVITDPNKATLFLRASDLLLGRDPDGMRYIKAYRKMQQLEAQKTG